MRNSNKNVKIEQNDKISLQYFIKEKKDLISALSIFASLTLFTSNFITGILGQCILQILTNP